MGGVLYNINTKTKRRRGTVDGGTGTDIKMGETVTAGDYQWKRIPDLQHVSQ